MLRSAGGLTMNVASKILHCKWLFQYATSHHLSPPICLKMLKRVYVYSVLKRWPTTDISLNCRLISHNNSNIQPVSNYQSQYTIEKFGPIESENLLNELAHNPKFSPSRRLELMNRIWTHLINNGVVLDENHFILKLKCYLTMKHKIAPKSFKQETAEAGVELSEKLLKLLLDVVAENGDPGYVSTVVTSMKSRNLTADDAVFASLIIAHAVRGDMASARHVIETMNECRVEPGEHTYRALMRAAVMAGDYSALHTAKIAAEKKGLLSTRSVLTVLETLVLSGKLHLLPSMEASVKQCSASEILALAESLIFRGFASGGYLVFKQISNLSAEQYSTFIMTMFHASISVSKILSVCGDMVSDGAHGKALYDVLECVLKEENIPDSFKVLHTCKERGLCIRPHYFWPLIASAARQHGEQGVYNILEKMTSFACPADADTLTEMVLSRISLDDPDSVMQRLRDTTGIPLSQILPPFLTHIVKCGLAAQAVNICKHHHETALTSRSPTLLKALATGYTSSCDETSTVGLLKLLEISDVSDWLATVLRGRRGLSSASLLSLLKALKKEKCFITPIGYRWIYRSLSQHNVLTDDINIALSNLTSNDKEIRAGCPQSIIPHPEEMNAEELECHVIELEAKGMNTRGALRRLLQVSCRSGDAKKAQQVYQKLREGGMALSPGILASLLEAYVKSAMPDDAVIVLKTMDKDFPKFALDCYKIMDLATLLIKKGRLEEATNLLQDRPQGHSSMKTKASWTRNAWELLVAAEIEGGVDQVEKFFDILITNNYTAPTNVVCGPLVKAYLKSNNIEGAVEKFNQFAEQNRVTPLQQELMQAVISSDKVHLLNRLVQAAANVHGMPSTQATLILALAHHGDPSILRQYLTSGNMSLETEQLKNQAQRAMELGHLKALKTLLQASLDVPRMDPDFLISLILQHFNRKGDTEGALTFWKELEELKIAMSDKHKSSLAALVAATAKT